MTSQACVVSLDRVVDLVFYCALFSTASYPARFLLADAIDLFSDWVRRLRRVAALERLIGRCHIAILTYIYRAIELWFLLNQPKSDCIYYFPIHLKPNEIPVWLQINRKMVNTIKFWLNNTNQKIIYLVNSYEWSFMSLVPIFFYLKNIFFYFSPRKTSSRNESVFSE